MTAAQEAKKIMEMFKDRTSPIDVQTRDELLQRVYDKQEAIKAQQRPQQGQPQQAQKLAMGGDPEEKDDFAKASLSNKASENLNLDRATIPDTVSGYKQKISDNSRLWRSIEKDSDIYKDVMSLSKEYNLSPSLIAGNLLSEGVEQLVDKKGNYKKNTPLDGRFIGADSLKDLTPELQSKKLLPDDFSMEDNGDMGVFHNQKDMLRAGTAMLKLKQDQAKDWATEAGINLSDSKILDLATSANYNTGFGNMKKFIPSMVDKGVVSKEGYTPWDTDQWADVNYNVARRTKGVEDTVFDGDYNYNPEVNNIESKGVDVKQLNTISALPASDEQKDSNKMSFGGYAQAGGFAVGAIGDIVGGVQAMNGNISQGEKTMKNTDKVGQAISTMGSAMDTAGVGAGKGAAGVGDDLSPKGVDMTDINAVQKKNLQAPGLLKGSTAGNVTGYANGGTLGDTSVSDKQGNKFINGTDDPKMTDEDKKLADLFHNMSKIRQSRMLMEKTDPGGNGRDITAKLAKGNPFENVSPATLIDFIEKNVAGPNRQAALEMIQEEMGNQNLTEYGESTYASPGVGADGKHQGWLESMAPDANTETDTSTDKLPKPQQRGFDPVTGKSIDPKGYLLNPNEYAVDKRTSESNPIYKDGELTKSGFFDESQMLPEVEVTSNNNDPFAGLYEQGAGPRATQIDSNGQSLSPDEERKAAILNAQQQAIRGDGVPVDRGTASVNQLTPTGVQGMSSGVSAPGIDIAAEQAKIDANMAKVSAQGDSNESDDSSGDGPSDNGEASFWDENGGTMIKAASGLVEGFSGMNNQADVVKPHLLEDNDGWRKVNRDAIINQVQDQGAAGQYMIDQAGHSNVQDLQRAKLAENQNTKAVISDKMLAVDEVDYNRERAAQATTREIDRYNAIAMTSADDATARNVAAADDANRAGWSKVLNTGAGVGQDMLNKRAGYRIGDAANDEAIATGLTKQYAAYGGEFAEGGEMNSEEDTVVSKMKARGLSDKLIKKILNR